MPCKHVSPGISVNEKEVKVRLNIPKLLKARGHKSSDEKHLLIVRSILRETLEALLDKAAARTVLLSVMKTLASNKLHDLEIEITPE